MNGNGAHSPLGKVLGLWEKRDGQGQPRRSPPLARERPSRQREPPAGDDPQGPPPPCDDDCSMF